jgi:hypothetical protein
MEWNGTFPMNDIFRVDVNVGIDVDGNGDGAVPR